MLSDHLQELICQHLQYTHDGDTIDTRHCAREWYMLPSHSQPPWWRFVVRVLPFVREARGGYFWVPCTLLSVPDSAAFPLRFACCRFWSRRIEKRVTEFDDAVPAAACANK